MNLIAAFVLIAAFNAAPAAGDAGASCTLDGAEWKIAPLRPALVVTNPVTGRRIQLNIYADDPKQLPYLQISALWSKVSKAKAKVSAHNAAPDAPLEAMFTAEPPGIPQPPDFVQAGMHFLQQGTLTVTALDSRAKLISLHFEGTLREGEPKHPKAHQVKVACDFQKVPLNEH